MPEHEQARRSRKMGARIPADEHRRRCSFWALNNLPPVVYSEFSKLNPDTMDDLDRILWRSQLNGSGSLGYYDDDPAAGEDGSLLLPRNPGIYCRDYWAEPLNRSNANLRNQGFEAECRFRLEDRIAGQYRRLRDGVHNDEGNVLVYNTPNQYVRILQWLDLSGEELLDAQEPPYSILHEESRRPYAHWQDRIPTEDGLDDYRRKYEETLNLGMAGDRQCGGTERQRISRRSGVPLLLPATLLRLLGSVRPVPDAEREPIRRDGVTTV